MIFTEKGSLAKFAGSCRNERVAYNLTSNPSFVTKYLFKKSVKMHSMSVNYMKYIFKSYIMPIFITEGHHKMYI